MEHKDTARGAGLTGVSIILTFLNNLRLLLKIPLYASDFVRGHKQSFSHPVDSGRRWPFLQYPFDIADPLDRVYSPGTLRKSF